MPAAAKTLEPCPEPKATPSGRPFGQEGASCGPGRRTRFFAVLDIAAFACGKRVNLQRDGVFMKVILLMAMTLDGKIARNEQHFPDWTGSADKKLFVQITKKAGAIIMGSKTFDTIGKPLPGRRNIVMTRNRSRQSSPPDLIYTASNPEAILDELVREGYREVVLAGGSIVNSLFARAKLIDEIVMTIAPRIFGTGISLFTDETDMQLDLKSVEPLDDGCVVLRYQVRW
jgi:dihydrofolate reductase